MEKTSRRIGEGDYSTEFSTIEYRGAEILACRKGALWFLCDENKSKMSEGCHYIWCKEDLIIGQKGSAQGELCSLEKYLKQKKRGNSMEFFTMSKEERDNIEGEEDVEVGLRFTERIYFNIQNKIHYFIRTFRDSL